jgi:hypothetical protein
MASFGQGHDTDEALRAVVKVRDMAALDREFRHWGLTHAGAFVDSSPWPYWEFYSPGIDPAVRNAIQFTHRPKPQ